MEEKNNKFWKGFLIGALCFFVIGALAVLGMTRFLESIAEKRGSMPGTEATLPTQAQAETTAPGEQPSSTAIAPVTIPTDRPSESTETPAPAETTAGEPRTIDRVRDAFLRELEDVASLFEEEEVMPYDMGVMQQAALKTYVELAGGSWAEYESLKPSYGPEVTVIEWNDDFLNRMGEIRELVDERIGLTDEQKTEIEIGTLKEFVAASGDVYSDYLTAEEWESTQQESDGSYCGIGVQIMQDPETMESTVTRVFNNSPAREAGMLAGDIFKKVDGMDVTQMLLEQIVTYVRGHEGEPVTLTVYRPATNETLDITCVRRKVEVDTVTYEMLTDRIGYLQLTEFDNVTIRQTREALESLQQSGMRKLILDLRGNPGGLLNSVLSVADYFVERGRLTFRMDYKDGDTYTEKAAEDPIFQGGMVVLVDKGSASAAEVLTGILQDYDIATVMGTTTFGKGIVQSYYDTETGSGSIVKLTIAHYYSPLGRDFHGVGLEPDITGEDDVLTEDKDELLEKAIEYLR
ncbi:MAG: PDZ domain-containing protein [Lachnospiraceae bacterium]|nr:PDZ domain-containing protein [Lachnospiraceae bacterium]